MATRLLCLAYRRLEYLHDAKSLLEEARTQAKQRGNKEEESLLLMDLGLTCLELGYPQKAISYLEQAQSELGQLCLLAQAYAVNGKWARARKIWHEAEPLALRDQTSAAQICLYLGLTRFFEGHMPEFLAHVRRAFDLTEQNACAHEKVQILLDQIAIRMRKDPDAYEALQKESNRYYLGDETHEKRKVQK
jgi:tetratricopeptide (TPR) repeat protein